MLVNLRRGRWLAPMRPETVYDKVVSLKRRLGAAVPSGWTPHWFRHTHASALLLSGAREHVVMRRLGHAGIQTTLNLYGWVSEDAELRALAEGIPDAFAGTVFDPADARLAGAFSARSESVLRTGSLPVPMQREISWWLATCQDNGERVVNANDWRRWAATAAGVAATA